MDRHHICTFCTLLFELMSPSQPDITFLNGDCSLRIFHQFSRGHVCRLRGLWSEWRRTCLQDRRCFPGSCGSWKEQHRPGHSFTPDTVLTTRVKPVVFFSAWRWRISKKPHAKTLTARKSASEHLNIVNKQRFWACMLQLMLLKQIHPFVL